MLKEVRAKKAGDMSKLTVGKKRKGFAASSGSGHDEATAKAIEMFTFN